MNTWIELFDLDVSHGYCRDASQCRLRLQPDERSLAWLDHAGVLLKVDDGSFADRLFVQRDMPPAGNTQLRACDLEKIQVWLNAGAPNN